ncbi:kinesin-14, putative [Bodo saltans]|uniref:Kinesin-like protein n=1 Tax=Bodo saltans TaxID=75058 RepID=A0A0S4K0Q6_BODSA|nr:kinesin-14, putative [Bodo saltans]|eukprot:CUG94395.1 kinesin-14, putative [Bodo saltans]
MESLVVEVFHPYRGQDKHQLTIAVGEKLTVIEKDPSGWWAGRNAKGVVGLFPSTYTRKATTVAPTADVTREVVAARILSEIQGPSDAARSTASSSVGLHNVDFDVDDVYALTDHEMEREIRRLVKDRDHSRRQNTETLQRIVDLTLATRSTPNGGRSDDAVQTSVSDVESQRLKIGRKRLDELIELEGQLRDETSEWEGILASRGVQIPEFLKRTQRPLTMDRAEEKVDTLQQAAPEILPSEEVALQQDENESDEWISSVQNETLRTYLRRLQKVFLTVNDFLDTLEGALEPLAIDLQSLERSLKKKQSTLDKLAEIHQEKVQQLFEHWERRVADAQREYGELKSGGMGGPKFIASLQDQVTHLEKQVDAGKKQHRKVDGEVEALKLELANLQDTLTFVSKSKGLHHETAAAQTSAESLLAEAKQIETEAKTLAQNDQAEYRKLERKRREIYNEIQELKGNLRVYCRIKPRMPNEGKACVTVVDDMTVRIADPQTESSQEHEFDFVIGESASQEEIFEEVRPLATSVLDGFNVCIFAYGQTGSGKTYTMEGPPSNRGINYRAVRELFTIAKERGDEYKSVLKVSILEVYNDKLFDLQNKRSSSKVRWGGESVGVVIEPLLRTAVTSADDVQTALEKAYLNRSVAGTECNAHSSRSHCILTIFVDATNNATGNVVTGKLHLIDLAGSERVKNSGVEGDRLKEATHINTSLTHLKTVIQGLANKSHHVAYRNSTLTSMLQDSLGGNCKCLMFANVSALAHNVPETICTIKYAAEARKVEVGKVVAKVRKS